ncbi:MAG TPA: aspartate aminotransferase family protein [Candidatus Dormibacteraeota bacterium]|jgi:ornithine--oxo-acid transaminase|nr:aspartate aminotransferase family protein [Candidatus Dormibacteraeota bacterium]
MTESTLAAAPDSTPADAGYSEHVNPQWVRLLSLLEMNVRYTRCLGAALFTTDGVRILDFLSGYCVHNLGHNHPSVIAALHDELDRSGPAMLQSHVPELAGALAAELCRLAGGRLEKVYFCSSGSEGVETVIKFARLFTRRAGLLYCTGAFHGLTCGALSLMADSSWAQGFAPLLPGAESVPFANLPELESRLASKKFAAFVVEPIQSEAGVRVPPEDYLREAQMLCKKYGTLFVLDEVQTGLYRTGPFLAAHHWGLDPDMVVLAKALSGGLVPSGAVLMSDEIYESVYSSLGRSIIHTSTYSENGLAMRAGLATLKTLQDEQLGKRSQTLGQRLRQSLTEALSGYEMVAEVRGLGMLNGIEFRRPESWQLRVPFEAFRKIHEGMFGQIIVGKLFREHNFLTQMCGNNFMVLKAAPPLMVSEEQITDFVRAVKDVVEEVHSSSSFWMDALHLARRAVKI